MVRSKEDDLLKLAAQAGKEGDSGSQDGISEPRFLSGTGRRGINQQGDDPGFETRVQKPAGPTAARTEKAAEKEPAKKAAPRPRGSAAERTIEEVSEALQERADEFFAVVSLMFPVTGVYGAENSDKAIRALLKIGKRRPKLLTVLMKAADGADGFEIGRIVLGLVMAVQVDMQRIPADALPARITGVTAVVEKYFTDDEVQVNPNVTEQATNAARFQPVS